jgi:hypothetical protein
MKKRLELNFYLLMLSLLRLEELWKLYVKIEEQERGIYNRGWKIWSPVVTYLPLLLRQQIYSAF